MKALPSSLLALLGLMLAGATAASDSSAAPAASPAADAELELICHTDNPAECYPKIFQATDEFQIVRPDQDIPKGLHVRLNMQTGEREAKINVPDEENPALAGLPVESSVVVVDPDTDADADGEPQRPRIPPNAPAYDPVGKIKTPQTGTHQDSADSSAFYKSLAILKKGLDVDEALEMLEDISHDIYYGLKIAEDYDTVRQLFCLANTYSPPSPSPEDSPVPNRAKTAALTIGSAIQNNPKALAEIERHWPALSKEICPDSSSSSSSSSATEQETLGTSTFRLIPLSSSTPSSPSLAKARISAISGLLKSPLIRAHFLANRGMERVLEVLVLDVDDDDSNNNNNNNNNEWEPAQRKAGLLVLDNFLDADMGAVLGEWPSSASPAQASDKECARRQEEAGTEASASEECWDWHAKRIADRNRKTNKGHWSVELWDKLRGQRRGLAAKEKVKAGKGGKDEL